MANWDYWTDGDLKAEAAKRERNVETTRTMVASAEAAATVMRLIMESAQRALDDVRDELSRRSGEKDTEDSPEVVGIRVLCPKCDQEYQPEEWVFDPANDVLTHSRHRPCPATPLTFGEVV